MNEERLNVRWIWWQFFASQFEAIGNHAAIDRRLEQQERNTEAFRHIALELKMRMSQIEALPTKELADICEWVTEQRERQRLRDGRRRKSKKRR